MNRPYIAVALAAVTAQALHITQATEELLETLIDTHQQDVPKEELNSAAQHGHLPSEECEAPDSRPEDMILAEAGYLSFATKALQHSAKHATRGLARSAGWSAKNSWTAVKAAGKDAVKKVKNLDDLAQGDWITSYNTTAKKIQTYGYDELDYIVIPLTAKQETQNTIREALKFVWSNSKDAIGIYYDPRTPNFWTSQLSDLNATIDEKSCWTLVKNAGEADWADYCVDTERPPWRGRYVALDGKCSLPCPVGWSYAEGDYCYEDCEAATHKDNPEDGKRCIWKGSNYSFSMIGNIHNIKPYDKKKVEREWAPGVYKQPKCKHGLEDRGENRGADRCRVPDSCPPGSTKIGGQCWGHCPVGTSQCGVMCLGDDQTCLGFVMDMTVNMIGTAIANASLVMSSKSLELGLNLAGAAKANVDMINKFNQPICTDFYNEQRDAQPWLEGSGRRCTECTAWSKGGRVVQYDLGDDGGKRTLQFVKQPMVFSEAQAFCWSNGMDLATARNQFELDLLQSIMPIKPDPNNKYQNDPAYARDTMAWIGSKMDPNIVVDRSRPGDVGAGAWYWTAEHLYHDINNTPGLEELDGRDINDMMYRMLVQARHDQAGGSGSHQGVIIKPGDVTLETDPSRENCEYFNPIVYHQPMMAEVESTKIPTRPGFSNWARNADKNNPDKLCGTVMTRKEHLVGDAGQWQTGHCDKIKMHPDPKLENTVMPEAWQAAKKRGEIQNAEDEEKKAYEDDLKHKPKRDFKYDFELVTSGALTWADAKTECETDPDTGEKWADERRTLAVITSVEDQRKVNELLNAHNAAHAGGLGGLGAWVGATDAEQEVYQYWMRDQSDKGENTDCATFWPQNWAGGDGVWKDAACGTKRHYVCSTRTTQYVDQNEQPIADRPVEKHPFFCQKQDRTNPFQRNRWPAEVQDEWVRVGGKAKAKMNTSPTKPYYQNADQEEMAQIWKVMGWELPKFPDLQSKSCQRPADTCYYAFGSYHGKNCPEGLPSYDGVSLAIGR